MEETTNLNWWTLDFFHQQYVGAIKNGGSKNLQGCNLQRYPWLVGPIIQVSHVIKTHNRDIPLY